jgi:uncharacterized radical SAM superfamily Fe-S cluster-containing enzyme
MDDVAGRPRGPSGSNGNYVCSMEALMGTEVRQITVDAVDGKIQLEFDDAADRVIVIMSFHDAKEVASALMRRVFEAEGAD